MRDEEQIRGGDNVFRLKRLIKDVLLYSSSALLVPISNLVTIPILTRSLTAEDYGSVETITSYATVLATLAMLGQDSAFARYYYHFDDRDSRLYVLKLSLLTLSASLAFVLVGTGAILSLAPRYLTPQFPVASNALPAGPALLWFYLLVVPLLVWFNFSRIVFKWLYHRVAFVISSSLYPVLLVLFYALIVSRVRSLQSVLVSQSASYVLTAVACFILFRNYFSLRDMMSAAPIRARSEDRGLLWHLLQFGFPYMCLGLFTGGARALDKTVLGAYHSFSTVGIYAVGFKIASLMLLVETAFNMAWGPIALTIYKQSDADETYNSAFLGLAVALGVLMFATFSFAGPIVLLASSPAYAEAAGPLKILLFGFVAQAMAGVTSVGIDLSKRTYLLVISWGLGFAFTAASLYALVPAYSLIGAAWAVTAGMVVEAILRSWLARRAHPIGFDHATALVIFAIPIAMMLTEQYLEFAGAAPALMMRAALVLLVTIASLSIFIRRVFGSNRRLFSKSTQ